MNPARYEISVDWAGDGTFTAPGDNITSRVFDRGTPLRVQYGRETARTYSPLTGGRGQFELNNSSRDYSPENASSMLAGNVRPGRPVRMRATLSGVTYVLVRGFLDDFEVLPKTGQKCVQITLVDALTQLRETHLSTPVYRGVRTGEAVGYLLDAAGWTAGRDLDPGASTLPCWWAEGQDAFSALQQILDAEGPGSLAAIGSDGEFVFRDRHHRILRTASTTEQATFRASGAEPVMSDLSYDHGWRDIVNSVTFAIPVRLPAVAEATVWQMQGTRTIADGETAEFTASASEPFINAVAPVAGSDFTLVSGTVSTALSRTSGQATTVYVTASGGPAIVADMSVRAVPMDVSVTATVQAEDTVSVGRYGRRSWPTGRVPTLAGVNDATAIADIILAHRAERLPTVSITLKGGGTARMLHQLARDLSDRVRIVDPETGLDAAFWIEQIDHTVSKGDHRTVFGCEKIPTAAASPFTFNKSGAGFNDGNFGDTGRDDPASVFIFDHATQGQFDVGLLGN